MHLLRLTFFALGGTALMAFLVGAAEPTAPAQPTVVTSDSFDMKSTDKETTSVFDGHVVVTGTSLKITCDHLEIISTRIGEKDDTVGKQDRFRSLIASGSVRILQGDREATCDRAIVLPREDKITLTGKPTVTDHGNGSVATGEPIILYRGDRRVHGENVQITLPQMRNLGFDPKQAPLRASDAPDSPATPAAPAPSAPSETSPVITLPKPGAPK